MSLKKRIRAFAFVMFFLTFLFSASITSCGKKAATEEDATDSAEHPTEQAEHPKADSTQEHPASADTVKSE